MSNDTEKTLSLRMSEDLLKQVDDYSFSARIRSRNEAIRDLIRAGLAARSKSRA